MDDMRIRNPVTGAEEYLITGDNQVIDKSRCEHVPDEAGHCKHCGRVLPKEQIIATHD